MPDTRCDPYQVETAYQLLTQSGDNFSKRSVESQSFLFPETGDGYSRTIQCDGGLK